MDTNTIVFMFFSLCTCLLFIECAEGQNPCQDMSVGDCTVEADNIIGSHPYPQDICQVLCGLDDLCTFWRHDETKEGTNEECLFISTDYHQDCKSFAGPVSGSITACQGVDQNSCWAILPEDCYYEGERLTNLEPGPGRTSSIAECLLIAQKLEVLGVTFFSFLLSTEECQLFTDVPSFTCTATGGAATAPPIDECETNGTTITITATKSTTPATVTTTPPTTTNTIATTTKTPATTTTTTTTTATTTTTIATTTTTSTTSTTEGPNWQKVFSHDINGGIFANLTETMKKNTDDEGALLFSVLYNLESMRNDDGVFHFKLCYPKVTQYGFPCNEWIQSSNPVVESTITGYAGINLTWNQNGIGGPFQGLGLSPPSFSYHLINDVPNTKNWYNSIGSIQYYYNCIYNAIPGPKGFECVEKKELYVGYTSN